VQTSRYLPPGSRHDWCDGMAEPHRRAHVRAHLRAHGLPLLGAHPGAHAMYVRLETPAHPKRLNTADEPRCDCDHEPAVGGVIIRDVPTMEPSAGPPTPAPTHVHDYPTAYPTPSPTKEPTPSPTGLPTYEPTFGPTFEPTVHPTGVRDEGHLWIERWLL
jgi:hypothetical protein